MIRLSHPDNVMGPRLRGDVRPLADFAKADRASQTFKAAQDAAPPQSSRAPAIAFDHRGTAQAWFTSPSGPPRELIEGWNEAVLSGLEVPQAYGGPVAFAWRSACTGSPDRP